MPDTHALDRAIALEVVDDDVVRGSTRPEWTNMVGPFGGVTAATPGQTPSGTTSCAATGAGLA
jgi:hypothetical protein